MLIVILFVNGVLDVVAAQKTRFVEPEKAWKSSVPQEIAYQGISSIPVDGAGCLVVGYYILRDGKVEKARVMQGAFTVGTSEAVQKSFTEAAIASANSWAFVYSGRSAEPEPAFEWTVLGYARAKPDAQQLALLMSQDRQDARVRDKCKLESLSDWGRKNVIAEQSNHEDQVLFPYDEPAEAFWVGEGELAPPRYPPDAFYRGVEGCVMVGLIVGSDGVPAQFRIMDSRISAQSDAKSKKLLENASIYTISQWRFAPGPDNLQRVPGFLQIPINFALHDPPPRTACRRVDLRKK